MNRIIQDDEIDLRELAGVIKKRLPFIILFIVLFTSLGAALTLLKPPVYRARGELFVAYDAPSHIERLTSPGIMERLKETLDKETFKGLDFNAEPGRGASFISLSVGAPHPDLAPEAVKIWIENYTSFLEERKEGEMMRISRLLDTMGEELENYPKYRIVKRAIVDDYALLDMEKDNDIWKRLEGKLMVTRDIHPLYRSFEEKIGREKIKLSRMRVEMDNLRAQVRESLVVEEAERESRPLKRNTALAAVLSLFMALVLAFVFEFFSSKKENNG